jgi:hypothetical protein
MATAESRAAAAYHGDVVGKAVLAGVNYGL